MKKCESCNKDRDTTVSAVINGVYYRSVCKSCLGAVDDGVSGGLASFNRRRDYEENAQDTIQPYNASGPNLEFLRLYPQQAAKVFSKEVIDELKRKL